VREDDAVHVLIVEDQAPIARLLRAWIEAEGMTVATATGAEQALLLAAEQAPAVALCDIRLPGGRDGFWFVEQLRLFSPQTAVVIVTGLPDLAGADGGHEGVADVVAKPFTRERVTGALRHALADYRLRTEQASAGLHAPVNAASALLSILHGQGGTSARHAGRVSQVAVTLARALGCDEAEAFDIGCAALLGDVQRVDIYAVAEKMPRLGAAIAIALAMEEHFDGSGFPLGLSGEAMARGARVVAVAGAYDALMESAGVRFTSPRQAVETLEGERAAHFDPAELRALREVAPSLEATAA
jgi:putative two-component system response regulator